uniref:Uncharacterized protein n=1 Tax=Solanum lycopersicum TaxID=4081 RepID=A0A3Q7H345_SOLLC
MPNFFMDVCQDFVYAYGWPSRLVRPIWKIKRAPKRAYPSFRRFSCAIAHYFLGDPDSDVKNGKFFLRRPSTPCLCIRLAITACTTHLEAYHFLGDPDSDVKMQNFFMDVRQDLFYAYGWPSRLVRPIWKHTIFWVIRLPTSKMPNFFVDIRQDLVYAYGWPSRLVRPIWKISTSKMPNVFVDVRQDVVYAYDWPSGLFRHIWKVKRASKRAYASFRRFSCAIAHHFLGDRDSDVKNAKFVRGRPSRRCLCIRLAFRAFPTHLEGQTSLEASIRLISTIFVCYCTPFLGDRNSDIKNAKFVRGRPSRRCLCIWLAITVCPTHFEGQTSPEASIPLISTIFVCYSTPFFG